MKTCSVALVGALLATLSPTLSAQDRTVVQSGSVLDTLPANTSVVLSIPNVSSLVAKIEASPIYQLKDDKRFASLFTQFEQLIEQVRQEARTEANADPVAMIESIQGELVLVLGDLTPIIQAAGEASLNMEEPEITSGMVPFMLSFDVGSKLPTFKENLQAILAKMVRDGAQLKSDKFHGGRITSIQPQNPDPEFDGAFIAEHGTKFIFGLQRKQIEETLVALGGEAPTSPLTKDPMFTFTREQTGKSSDVVVFVNLRPILTAVDAALAQNPFVFVWQAIRDILFGKTLNNFALSYSFEPEGIRTKGFVHNSGAGDGLLGWFKGTPFDSRPSNLIPDDALVYLSSSFNPEAMNNTVRRIVELASSFMAVQGESFDFDAKFEEETGVPFKSFLASFGDRFHYFSSTAPTGENLTGDFNLVLELKDQDVWTKLLNKAVAESGGSLQPEKYMNRDIYASDIALPEFGGGKPAICVTDNRLLFGFHRESVEKVIRRIGKDAPGLGEKDAFKKAMSGLPSKVSALSYSSREYSDATVKFLESMTQTPGFGADEVPPELFQFFGALMEKLGDGVGHCVWNEQGYYVESTALYRK